MSRRPAGLVAHPAEWSDEVLAEANRLIPVRATVLDPMAGTGWRLERGLPGRTLVGIELEPEWAAGAEWVQQGDARDLPFSNGRFSWVITSPTFGNRMADHHNAQERCKPCDGTGMVNKEGEDLPLVELVCEKCQGEGRRTYKRLTYTHTLGRPLTDGNTGNLGWTGREGDEYRSRHEQIWAEVWRVMRGGGTFLLNTKNHYRTLRTGEPAEEMKVTEWHVEVLEKIGFEVVDDLLIETPGMRFGDNRDVRADHDHLVVLHKPKARRSPVEPKARADKG